MTADLLLIVCAAFLGLLVGSFLNVVIYRIPAGMSLWGPRSECPRCKTTISARDNIPLLSWLLLRARCRVCAQPISARYPLVELLTAAVFAVLAARFGSNLMLLGLLYLGAASVALALIDIDTHRLPNAIVLPSYAIGGVLLLLPTWSSGDWSSYLRAWEGAGALYGFYFALRFAYPAGMGFGDVKLAGVLGLFLGYLGWGPLLVGTFAASLLGGVAALWLVLVKGGGRKTALPYGPAMLAGCLLALLAGEQLTSAYLGLAVS